MKKEYLTVAKRLAVENYYVSFKDGGFLSYWGPWAYSYIEKTVRLRVKDMLLADELANGGAKVYARELIKRAFYLDGKL